MPQTSLIGFICYISYDLYPFFFLFFLYNCALVFTIVPSSVNRILLHWQLCHPHGSLRCEVAVFADLVSTAGCCGVLQTGSLLLCHRWHSQGGSPAAAPQRRTAACTWSGTGCRSRRCCRKRTRGQRCLWRCREGPLETPGCSNWSGGKKWKHYRIRSMWGWHINRFLTNHRVQGWANYGLGSICGLLSILIQPPKLKEILL